MRLAASLFLAALAACSDPGPQPTWLMSVGNLHLYQLEVEGGREYEIRNDGDELVRVWIEELGGTNHAVELHSFLLGAGQAAYAGWAGPEIEEDPWSVEVYLRSRPVARFPQALRGKWIAVRDFGTEQWAWPLKREEYGETQHDVLSTEGREQLLLIATESDEGLYLHFESTARMLAAPSEHRDDVHDLYLLDEHNVRTLVLSFEVRP